MATSVGLNFRLTAAVDKFEASMKDVERRLDSIDRSSRQTAQGMKLLAAIEIGKSVLSGLTGLFNIFKGGVQTVISFSSQAAAAADAIGKLSSATGMAEEPLQVFTQLASYSGVSSTQFGDALQKMSRGLGEAANGTGTAARGLQQLGLSVDSLLGMSPSEQFLKIGSAIGKIEDPTMRSAIAADVFGRSGTKLIPMFEDMENTARATAQEMLQLGQVLSGTQVDNIEAMNDSFEKVRQTAFKIGSQVLANFAPALTEANGALIELIKNFEYEGVQGGQGLANYLTQAFFTGVDKLTQWADYLLNGLIKFVQGASEVAALLLDAAAGLASWVASDETVDGLKQASANARAFGESLDGVSSDLNGFANQALAGFKTSATEAADSLIALTSKTSATTETMQGWVRNGMSANDAMADLTSGIIAASNTVPISLRELGAATERAVMSLDISGPATAVKGALDALIRSPSAAAQGLVGLAGGFLDILAPLGFTKEKILELGQAAAAHSGFKEQLIRTAMQEFDQVAQSKLKQYIAAGANPFAMFAKMQEERNAYLARVNADISAKEAAWIEATGGLTGSMKITSDQVKEAGGVLAEKLGGAATTAADWASGLVKDAGDWLGGLFGGSEGGNEGPQMPEPEQTLPELQSQTTKLDGILTAVQGFGANFVQATF